MRRQTILPALVATLAFAGASCASGDANKSTTTTVSPATTAGDTAASTAGSGSTDSSAASTAGSATADTTSRAGGGAQLVHALDDATAGGAADVIAVDKAGNPVVAWGVAKADGDPTTIISSSTYDPTKGAYLDPVQVAAVPTSSKDYLSIASDPTSGTLAIAFEDNSSIDLATSADNGATWTSSTIAPTEDEALVHPKVAIAGGKAYVLYSSGDALFVTSAPLTGTGSADNVQIPGDGIRGGLSGGIAASGSTVGVAFFVASADGGTDVDYWKVGDAASVKVTDSGGRQNDSPSVAIAFSGTKPVIAASLDRTSGTTELTTVYTSISADGGKTFADPVAMPLDASASTGFQTAIATGSGSSAAIAYSSNSGGGDDVCGEPKLIQTTNLTDWKICSVVPVSPFTDFGYPALAASPDGSTLYASFSNAESGSNLYALGISSVAIPFNP
ncbi:MAG: Fibronectin, type domain protein [Ilumatobacteraceae bacterium]|nr:Fibronectin, type domain protein [Ilumatobacteraceae bacterium]